MKPDSYSMCVSDVCYAECEIPCLMIDNANSITKAKVGWSKEIYMYKHVATMQYTD